MTDIQFTTDDLRALEQAIISTARQAGEAIMAIYQTDFSVNDKQDKSPVTEADIAAHKIITQQLEQMTTELPVLSEEASHIPLDIRHQWQTYWLVDPLDGTREFIKRNGEFTVNIALIQQHKPILGVVYVPTMGKAYYAAQDLGAYCILDNEETAQPIHARPCPNTPVIFGSRSHETGKTQTFLDKVGDYKLVLMGSSLKSCMVAEGKADLYPRFGPTSEWDTGAAQCIVEEAGACLVDMQMQPLDYNRRETLLNPEFMVFSRESKNWSEFL